MKKRILAGLLSLLVLAGLLPVTVLADDVGVEATEVTQTATNLDSNYLSNVTMTFPSDEYSRDMDIVFVLDGSTSTDQTTLTANAAAMLDELKAIPNLNAKVGVVLFGGYQPVLETTPLTKLDETSVAMLKERITTKDYNDKEDENGNKLRSGSNLQAGIEAARDMLSGDEDVEAKDKYVILLSDGGARMWINEDGVSVAQMPYTNNWNTNEDFRYRHINDGQPTFSSATRPFADVFAAGEEGKIGKYAITKEQYEQNKTTSTYLVWTLSGETIDVDTSPDYYTNLESATYFAARSLTEMKENGEANVIWVDYPYNKGTAYGNYTESFKSWLAEEGYVSRYDSDVLSAPFEAVENSLVCYVDNGSTVTNVIGFGTDNYGNAYDFEMVNDAAALTLTVGGTAYPTTQLPENTYGFGTPDADGTYPFELTYYPDGEDGQSGECFVLAIHTAVRADVSVELRYQVRLTNPQTMQGSYGVYDEDGSECLSSLRVSAEATLHPVDSDKNVGADVPFPLPTVSYTVGGSASGPDTVTVNVAPITVYVGGAGYEGVVTNQQGDVAGVAENTLPEPGYTIDLPEEMDRMLKQAVGVDSDTAVDLSGYLKFTYDDQNGTTRVWTVQRYDRNEGNTSMINGRYLYRLVSAPNQPAIRLEFKSDDGSLMTSDNFTIDQDNPNQTYSMSIHAGALDQELVQAELTLPGASTAYCFDIAIAPADLKIRGVVSDEEDPTTAIVNSEPEQAVSEMTAQVSEDTKFFYKTTGNEASPIQVADGSAVKLLVDEVLPSAVGTLKTAAVEQFDALPANYRVETRYLDLVYTSNSNAVVAASNPVTVYWPYPEGTDENTEFFIVHYEGLDRNGDEALTDDYEMKLYTAGSQEDGLLLENTAQGIRITVNSFSPFALFWAGTGSSGSHSGGGTGGSALPTTSSGGTDTSTTPGDPAVSSPAEEPVISAPAEEPSVSAPAEEPAAPAEEPETPTDPGVPQTGDSGLIALWAAVCAASLGGLLLSIRRVRSLRGAQNRK